MGWWYDSNSERVLGCILTNGSKEWVRLGVLCGTLRRSKSELKSVLSDLERAGFVETLERSKKYRVTEEGLQRLMKGLSQGEGASS